MRKWIVLNLLLGLHGSAFAHAGKPIQLYDLTADIGEKKNVLADHPEVTERLRSYAVTFQEELRRNRRPAGIAQNPKPLTK